MLRKWILVITLTIASFNVFSSVDINCRVRYQTETKVNTGTINGEIIGKQNVYVPRNSTKSWSIFYSVTVRFYSGEEFNELVGKVVYNQEAVIAAIEWADGSASFILTRLTCTDKLFTAEAITSNFKSTSGSDLDNRQWEIYF